MSILLLGQTRESFFALNMFKTKQATSKIVSVGKRSSEHQYFLASRSIELIMLQGFADGNFECEFYTFSRSNQEQLRKMQL
jgi:hypothetical protein